MKKILLYSLCLLSLTACHKHDQGWENEAHPWILPGGPNNNEVFSAGQTAKIWANIFDNHGLVEIQVNIFNATSGILLQEMHATPSDPRQYYLEEKLQVQAGMQYRIEIIAKNIVPRKATHTILISAN